MLKKLIGTLSLWSLPLLALAQTAQPTTQISNYLILLDRFKTIVNAVVPFIIGLAVLVIVWGIFNYIIGAGDEEKRAEAKQYIIWGIIGVFVMLSIWGLVNVLVGSFAFQPEPDFTEARPF